MSGTRYLDRKILELGFIKVKEDRYGISYVRYHAGYCQVVDLSRKASGKHLIQSYDKDLMDEQKIGNVCVGLTYEETKLFLKKMKLFLKKMKREGMVDKDGDT